ncbi:MAG: response regulator [Ignavibacteria bacterium]|jgi:CheY-like chemotaxis protein|nr:response regulator [Ignavibacteria bacterium]
MKKMLIVEDDNLSVSVMQRLFQNDFEIFSATSAKEFYEYFDNTVFDIVIMDISLRGGKNGLEIIEEINANPKYPRTPIICFTAHSHIEIKQKAIQVGVDHFLTKPVSNAVLMEAVQSLIKIDSISIE